MKGLLKDLQCARTQAVTVTTTEVMSIVQHTLTCKTSGTQQSLVIHKSGAQNHNHNLAKLDRLLTPQTLLAITLENNVQLGNRDENAVPGPETTRRNHKSGRTQSTEAQSLNPQEPCAKLRQCCLRCRNRLDSAAGCAQEKKRCRNVCRRARESRMKLLLSTRRLTRKP